jgi:hypothetical protein
VIAYPKLVPYRCDATHPKTGRCCGAVLLAAWSPSGAVVKRRCKDCGAWQTVIVAADDAPVSEDVAALLD